MKRTVLLLLLAALISCDRTKQKTKEVLNEGGETVGKTATEFIEGISEGVGKTLECRIALSDELKAKGLETGKYAIGNNDSAGTNNVLTIYFIFNKDFQDEVRAKAFDKNGLEVGRATLDIKARAGEAGYYDFKFDPRTYIESKSLIELGRP